MSVLVEEQEWSQSMPSSIGFECNNANVTMLEKSIDLRGPQKCSVPKNVVGVNATIQVLAQNSSHTMRARPRVLLMFQLHSRW